MATGLREEILTIFQAGRECNITELKRAVMPQVGFCTYDEVNREIQKMKAAGLVMVARVSHGVTRYRLQPRKESDNDN